MTARYWFARRFPVGNPRAAMGPVSPEGWLVVAGFVTAMAVGGVLLLGLMATGQVVAGVAVFAAIAAVSGGLFIWLATVRGDTTRMIADYRQMRQKGST